MSDPSSDLEHVSPADTPSESSAQQQQAEAQFWRVIGVVMLGISLVAWVLGYLIPYVKAAGHAMSVKLWVGWGVVAPAVLILGVAYILLGHRSVLVLGPWGQPTKAMWALSIVAALVGLVVYILFKQHIGTMGYGRSW
jgi:hypothetical protein